MSPVSTDGEPGSGGEPRSALPVRFTDADGRRIALRTYAGEGDALAAMYASFEPADRAQGLPPTTESRRRAWLDGLLDDGLHVLAWHGDAVVGHVALLPIGDGRAELAIFVARDYQRATIGTNLVEAVLEYGRERGIERVWLTVERRNHAARRLYESVGFREVASGAEHEFERDL